jgi:hypothetical protein
MEWRWSGGVSGDGVAMEWRGDVWGEW